MSGRERGMIWDANVDGISNGRITVDFRFDGDGRLVRHRIEAFVDEP